jgi:hypothetical protein
VHQLRPRLYIAPNVFACTAAIKACGKRWHLGHLTFLHWHFFFLSGVIFLLPTMRLFEPGVLVYIAFSA